MDDSLLFTGKAPEQIVKEAVQIVDRLHQDLRQVEEERRQRMFQIIEEGEQRAVAKLWKRIERLFVLVTR
ncbi:MAG: hypothetical protein UU48_C0001G0132 [Candidatus Uhrbacteria bacterium GW2011_GWF2_41_16]|uniref:Uncharacterized protein n=1 Tax=Candidatus Uhrbacteria bacterium GW2011_GWF2_41_16 TaxID=1618997 RepID=A0A0G0YEM2_9BACT|nr:MAG: hypothetical protein UU48_C0001G0132 [Candidatus Uhrbacteria bacterium GW2011_GWF2_41_16]